MIKKILFSFLIISFALSTIAQDYTGIKMGIKLPYSYNCSYYMRLSDRLGAYFGGQATTFPFSSTPIGYFKMWGADEKMAEILREPYSIGAGVDLGMHYYFGSDNRRYYVGFALEWMNLLKRDIEDKVINEAFNVDLDSYPVGPILENMSVKPLTLNTNYLNLGFVFGKRFLLPYIPDWEMALEFEISKTVYSHHFLFSDYRYITPVEKTTSTEMKKMMLKYGWFPTFNILFLYKIG